jgi:hypothetical protein
MKSREPLDFTEEQGRYNEAFFKYSKLRRGRTIYPSHQGHRIYMWICISGFCGWKSCKYCNRNRDILIHDIPKAKGTV